MRLTRTMKDGTSRVFATISVDDAQAAKEAGVPVIGVADPLESNKHFILASLRSGGDAVVTLKEIGALGLFDGAFVEYKRAAQDANGLKDAPGETEPAAPA